MDPGDGGLEDEGTKWGVGPFSQVPRFSWMMRKRPLDRDSRL